MYISILMTFCVLVVFKWYLGKKMCTIIFPFPGPQLLSGGRYPVRLEQQTLPRGDKAVKENRKSQGVGGSLDGAPEERCSRGLTAGSPRHRPGEGLGKKKQKHKGGHGSEVSLGQQHGQGDWKHEWKIPSLGSMR